MFILSITWLLLLLSTVTIFRVCSRDYTAPVFLISLSFFSSLSVVLINWNNWDIKVHGFGIKAAFCIFLTIVSFSAGSLCGRALFADRSKDNNVSISSDIRKRADAGFPYIFLTLIAVLLSVLFLRSKIGRINILSLSSVETGLRNLYVSGREANFFQSQELEIIVAVSYLCLHRLLIEKYYLEEKVHFLLFIPVLCLLICSLFNTDRNLLIRFFLFGLALLVMSSNWRGINLRNNKKLRKKVVVISLALVVLFYIYGKLKSYTSNFERMIGIYGGSGLYAFNLWAETFEGPYTYGLATFHTLQMTLQALGFPIRVGDISKVGYTTFLSSNGYIFATNIYSALQDYYQDFGFFGIAFFPFLEGIFFRILYIAANKNKYGFWWLFYAAHIYHIVYFPIDEQFFKRFHLGLVYEVFWLFFFYKLSYGRIRIKEKHLHINM